MPVSQVAGSLESTGAGGDVGTEGQVAGIASTAGTVSVGGGFGGTADGTAGTAVKSDETGGDEARSSFGFSGSPRTARVGDGAAGCKTVS
jgi:hypothetical protein